MEKVTENALGAAVRGGCLFISMTIRAALEVADMSAVGLAAAARSTSGRTRLPGLPRLRVCHLGHRYPPVPGAASRGTNAPVGQDGWSLPSWLAAKTVDRDLNGPPGSAGH